MDAKELNSGSQGSCPPALDISESGEDIFPMPTLLEKCRQQAKGHRGQHNYCGCCTWWEAAEEIERLRAIVQQMLNCPDHKVLYDDPCPRCSTVKL